MNGAFVLAKMKGLCGTCAVALCVAIACLTWSCAHSRGGYQAEVLYERSGFDGWSVSGGSILVLPVLTSDGIDTTGVLNPNAQRGWVRRWGGETQKRFEFRRDFEAAVADSLGRDYLEQFYSELAAGDVVSLQSRIEVWNAIDPRYVLVPRVVYAARIKGFDGTPRRKVRLEGELWDSDSAEVVWRVSVIGVSRDQRIEDDRFLRGALRSMYSALPNAAYPGTDPAGKRQEW